METHSHSSSKSEDLLESLANLCSGDNVNKTFAQLISNKQKCLELKEASIYFPVSEMLQLIHIENTQHTSNVRNEARELLKKHSPQDVILSCWTGLLNLLLSKSTLPVDIQSQHSALTSPHTYLRISVQPITTPQTSRISASTAGQTCFKFWERSTRSIFV